MSIPKITIVLIFLFAMLTGCHTPLIDVHVDVRNGVQPGGGDPHGPGGGCPPGVPWYACRGGGAISTGVLKKIFDTDGRKVYEVEIKEQDRRLYFSKPPDEVEPGLKEGDTVSFSFEDPKNKLAKAK